MIIKSIVCYVSNLKKSSQFYELLGLSVDRVGPNHTNVELGNGVTLELHEGDQEDIPDLFEAARKTPRGNGLFIYVRVDDVNQLNQALSRKGVQVSPVRERPWGNHEFVCVDPDGYQIAFYTRS